MKKFIAALFIVLGGIFFASFVFGAKPYFALLEEEQHLLAERKRQEIEAEKIDMAKTVQNSPAHIEEVARQYGYTYPDEILFYNEAK